MAPTPKRSIRTLALCGAALFTCGHSQILESEAMCTGSDCPSPGDDVQLLQFRKKSRGLPESGPGSWKDWLHKYVALTSETSIAKGKSSLSEEETYQKCFLNESDCSLGSMGGKPTLVFPGGETKCFNGDDYAFAVVPGSEKQLLYYFEGGGACWEANGAFGKQVVLQCTDSLEYGIATTGFGYGVQDRANESNPFKTYTVVEPIYCSGDAFMGNTTMESNGQVFIQKGAYNGRAVLEWTKKNFPNELSSLVVSGFSAGSLGTMAWADSVLSSLTYKKAAVIMDSYAGIFPSGTQGPTIARWGACGAAPIPSELQSQCEANTLTIKAVLESTMSKFPSVPFASIQSKADGTQLWFYQGMAQSWGMVEDMNINGPEFYEGTNTIFESYCSGYPNYVPFYVEGDVHCFTQSPLFYTASAVGQAADAEDGQPMLYQWVQTLVCKATGGTQCYGPAQPNGANTTAYCDEALLPHTLKTVPA